MERRNEMRKVSALILFLFLCFAYLVIPRIGYVEAQTRTIVVPDEFSTIFLAVEEAREGDTVFVKSGLYEGPINKTLIVNKTISITGENIQTTTLVLHPEWITQILFGTPLSYYANPILIEANEVKISGFTITSDGGEIAVKGNNTQLTGNVFRVDVALMGDNQLFSQNTLLDADVFCRGSYASVNNNKVLNGMIASESGSYDKIFDNEVVGSIAIGGTSSHELVYGNSVKDGSDFYWAGISIASIGTFVVNNKILNCSKGISYDWGGNNTAKQNIISNCRGPAVSVAKGYSDFTFTENQVQDNLIGVQAESSFSLYYNNFVNNNLQVEILDENIYFWSMDNGTIGNYWSNYNGTDSNGDGIGDTPYLINKQNKDNYPLMAPIELEVIPEFSSWTILPILLVLSFVIIFSKNKFRKKGLE